MSVNKINNKIKTLSPNEVSQISNGEFTFGELFSIINSSGVNKEICSRHGEFIKRPIKVEAFQNDGGKPPAWILDCQNGGEIIRNTDGTLTIKTLEGDMLCQRDDYIVKGIENEIYPVKREIFEKTYEEVKSPFDPIDDPVEEINELPKVFFDTTQPHNGNIYGSWVRKDNNFILSTNALVELSVEQIPEYAQRFLKECTELMDKMQKLSAFIKKIEDAPVEDEPKHDCPLRLLKDQLCAMQLYYKVLEDRSKFEGTDLFIAERGGNYLGSNV